MAPLARVVGMLNAIAINNEGQHAAKSEFPEAKWHQKVNSSFLAVVEGKEADQRDDGKDKDDPPKTTARSLSY